MSFYQQETTPLQFVELSRELLYDGPHDQETRITEARIMDLNQLEFDVQSDPNYLLCSDVYLEVDLVVQKQQADVIDREQERTNLDPVTNSGLAFADRTKRYVPVPVPLDINPGLNRAQKIAATVHPDTLHQSPNIFMGIHACDGLALQQNIAKAHLTFKTVSIDEKPSEYIGPLIQLHGDAGMDRICQGSGRGLTDFSEDTFDRGANMNALGEFKTDPPVAWNRLHTAKGQRRTFTGAQFTEDSTWTRSHNPIADHDAHDVAQGAYEEQQVDYEEAKIYLEHPADAGTIRTFTGYLGELAQMADDPQVAILNLDEDFEDFIGVWAGLRGQWTQMKAVDGLISWLAVRESLEPVFSNAETWRPVHATGGHSLLFYQILTGICQ